MACFRLETTNEQIYDSEKMGMTGTLRITLH